MIAPCRELELLLRVRERISYKPRTTLHVSELDGRRAQLVLCGEQDDARGGGAALRLSIYEVVPLATIHTEADALQAFARLIAKFELHEAAEFFRVDGATVFLPHRAGAEHGGLTWSEFSGLGGRFLRALHTLLSSEADASLNRDVAHRD